MTDGPYRSLPMSDAWKRAAKALAKPAFSQSEANECVLQALAKDFVSQDGRRMVALVGAELHEGPQGSLFPDTNTAMDRLRERLTPNALSDALLRHLECGETLQTALGEVLRGEAASGFRTMEEVFRSRISQGDTTLAEVRHLVAKSDAALQSIDFSGLAGNLLGGRRLVSNRSREGRDRTEEGPVMR